MQVCQSQVFVIITLGDLGTGTATQMQEVLPNSAFTWLAVTT